MPYDRARRSGEDVVEYGVETQRLAASAAPGWRAMLREGFTSEAFIEQLASPLPVAPGTPPRARWQPTPVAASTPAAQPTAPGPLVNQALNPAVYDLATAHPHAYQDALTASGGKVPSLFGGSDLPSTTASGIDPNRLAEAHWMARPAIASAGSVAEAEELLAMASGPTGDAVQGMAEVAGHPGVRDYLDNVRAFAEAGTAVMRRRQEDAQIAAARQVREQIAAAAGTEPTPDDDYEALFGPLAAHQQRTAQLRSGGPR